MSRSPARATGAFGLAHVVLLLTGFAIAMPSVLHSSPAGELTAFYVDGPQVPVFVGGYLECVGLLMFLPFAAGLHRRLREREPRDGFAAATAGMAAVSYLTISLAPGMSAMAAGVYLGHRGVEDPALLAMVTNLRSFSYFLSLLALSLFLVAVACSAWSTGALPRALSGAAAGIGVALAVSLTRATDGWSDLVTLLVLVWLVAVSVWLLTRRAQVPAAQPVGQAVA